MKKVFVLFVVIALMNNVYSQNFAKLVKFKMEETEDYEEAEDQVVECVDYMFSHPIDNDDLNRLYAFRFISRWMDGTEYMFTLGDEFIETYKGNKDILPMYMAAMAKSVLESKTTLSEKQINKQSKDMLAKYCSKKSNKLRPTKVLKKIIKAKY